MAKQLVIDGLQIYAEHEVIKSAGVVIDSGIITEVGTVTPNSGAEILTFPADWHLIPGMIDMHIHGAVGADAMDANSDALTTISRALPAEGVTAFLATTMTAAKSDIDMAVSNIANYVAGQQLGAGAELLGINLEGPFLAAGKAGAQEVSKLINPELNLFNHWQHLANGLIKIVTVAPELPGGLDFIRQLKQQGVIAALGHSEADFAETKKAIAAGCSHATHLFDAMPAVHHRQPGAVTAILLDDRVQAEVIADGVHLHPAILQMVFKLKTAAGLVLITDAIRAKGLADGDYSLAGQQVQVRKGEARLADGRLAGSTLTMDAAVRNMLQFTQGSLLDMTKMTAENPAKELGLFHRLGSIAAGKDADLVVLDANYQVRLTIAKGRVLGSYPF